MKGLLQNIFSQNLSIINLTAGISISLFVFIIDFVKVTHHLVVFFLDLDRIIVTLDEHIIKPSRWGMVLKSFLSKEWLEENLLDQKAWKQVDRDL